MTGRGHMLDLSLSEVPRDSRDCCEDVQNEHPNRDGLPHPVESLQIFEIPQKYQSKQSPQNPKHGSPPLLEKWKERSNTIKIPHHTIFSTIQYP